jgi:predicted membrane protein
MVWLKSNKRRLRSPQKPHSSPIYLYLPPKFAFHNYLTTLVLDHFKQNVMWNTVNQTTHPDDHANATAIFGELKKYILSKNFRFGQITNVCGTTLFDFSQADINGAVVIDISQLFGEVKIKVPASWHVVIETTNIFATVDDRRKNTGMPIDYNKVLVLKGVNVCATVVIKAAV